MFLEQSRHSLVSVVIPAYKAAKRIRETLDSVYAQTYQNFEIVLVNDGSPDTEALELAIQGYDERLRYIRQENQGPSGARNTAIRAAGGKYIACLDSDDVYFPHHLERLVSLIEANGLDLVYCNSHLTKDGKDAGRTFDREPQIVPVTFDKLLDERCCVATSAMMASREAMLAAGLFDERYRRCEDFDLWLRMAYRGARMDLSNEVGVEHRLMSDGLSSDDYLLKLGRIEVYKKTLNTLQLTPEQKKLIQNLIARTAGLCEMDLAKRHLREGRYRDARAAAEKAAILINDVRSRVAAFAIRLAPWIIRRFLAARDLNESKS